MAADEANNTTIAQLKNRLIELDRERASVLDAIEQLQSCGVAEVRPTPSSHDIRHPAKTKALSNADKIALFRSLFVVETMSSPSGGSI